jgi:hypothetical protein
VNNRGRCSLLQPCCRAAAMQVRCDRPERVSTSDRSPRQPGACAWRSTRAQYEIVVSRQPSTTRSGVDDIGEAGLSDATVSGSTISMDGS